MGDFQLSSSFLQGGYRPARTGLLGDFHLTVDPSLLQPQMGLVSVQLFADKDAVQTQQPQCLFSGGASSVQGRTNWGADLNLRIGVGRDQAGGAAGFFTLQIGPDIPPAAVGP